MKLTRFSAIAAFVVLSSPLLAKAAPQVRYVCSGFDSASDLTLSIGLTDEIAATRPDGSKVYMAELTLGNKQYSTGGVVTGELIEFRTSKISLMAKPSMALDAADHAKFNQFVMNGVSTHVVCEEDIINNPS